MGGGRTTCALAFALAAHVAIAALLPSRKGSAPFVIPPASDALASVGVELEDQRAASMPLEPASEDALQAARSARSARRAATATTTMPAGRSGETAEAGAAVGALGHETWTFPTARIELGLGERTGALALARANANANANASASANANGPHRETESATAAGRLLLSLDSIDAAQGRARTGPLREAVDEVARRAEAPMEGVALFEITVGPKQPARARLLDASSEFGGWSGLTEALDTAARKKTLRVPPNGQALRVVVRVEAAMRLVDGRREKDLGVKTTSSGLGLQDNVAPGESKVVLPSATLHLRGNVCSLSLTAGLTTSPISGGCSLEAIGTRASRRVTTTLVSEERISLAQ